jgi:uncharacterized protein
MSQSFVPFLFELRKRKVKVGAHEAMALARALVLGLHDSSLDGFYHVARALLVHRESDLDAFDEAFAAHFRGVTQASLKLVDELEAWLKDPRPLRQLSAEEKALLESLDMEELRRLFEERLREQKERHDGGNRWIGTGGTSPFGAQGFHPTGLRVGSQGGGRSALGIADARRYRPYRSDLVLDVRQIEVALRKLRAFAREGADLELDLDGTIDQTAKNAGELEIVLRPPRKSNVRVLLLMDVGGSMDPHARLVSQLFSAAKRASNFRELVTYYFHNCVYGRLYQTERFDDPVKVRDVLEKCGPEYKLVVVGDAAMHPAELLGGGDWYFSRDEIEAWLKDPRRMRELTPEEKALIESLDMDELRRLFEERLREQKERHDGGNRWIGTGGTSPFGAQGLHPTGLRVGSQGGGRSALGIADARRYRPYRSDLVLDVRQIEVALRKLRAFSREGLDLELDLDGTIDKTAKNAGELEIVLHPPRKSNVRVLLLMDVGGSMDPHARLVSQLFSAAKRASNFRELMTYYFHNCIYGRLYQTERFDDPVKVRDVLEKCGREYKLVLVGDAAMHPAELLGGGDWYFSRDEIGGEAMHGIKWMQLLSDHFRRSVWLNPDPPSYWKGGTAEMLGSLFSMFPLTLDGLGEAVAHLSKGAGRKAA